jgi:abortive infection bacteriophage resistance protein
MTDKKHFQDKNQYKQQILKMLEDLNFSKELFIKHYYKKYQSPKHPPAWITIEALTFGQCVMIYGLLKKENQKLVADTYGINKKFIHNWHYALAIIRNFCAHHSRLWNREMVIRLNKRHGYYGSFFNNTKRRRVFDYLIVMQIISCKFNPTSSWNEKLEKIIKEHEIRISHMGFPENWKERLQKIKDEETLIQNLTVSN